MPRGASSGDELAIETSTTGACCPWNLSTVPTGRSDRAVGYTAIEFEAGRDGSP